MEEGLSEMVMVNKCNWTFRKDDIDTGMEYTVTGMKCVTTINGKKLVVIIHFKDEMVGLCTPKRFNSKAAGLEKKMRKIR